MTNFGKMCYLIRYESLVVMLINFCYSVNLIGCKDKCTNIGYSWHLFRLREFFQYKWLWAGLLIVNFQYVHRLAARLFESEKKPSASRFENWTD